MYYRLILRCILFRQVFFSFMPWFWLLSCLYSPQKLTYFFLEVSWSLYQLRWVRLCCGKRQNLRGLVEYAFIGQSCQVSFWSRCLCRWLFSMWCEVGYHDGLLQSHGNSMSTCTSTVTSVGKRELNSPTMATKCFCTEVSHAMHFID